VGERTDEDFMAEAIREAEKALAADEVPVGCVVVCGDEVLARAHNERESLADPTAHAEILALRRAAQARGNWHLEGVTLYCTLEPCCMCAGALVNARVDRLVFGLADAKSGAAGSVVDLLRMPALNHRVEVKGGVMADEVLALMRRFFEPRRRSCRDDGEQ
jgi:tRNA(adenine34) deaminase